MAENKIKKTKINQFDGGITRDIREQSFNKFKITKNFDIFSDAKRMQPIRALTDDENKTYKLTQFIQVNGNIYAYGVVVGGAAAKVYKKADPNDIFGSLWVGDGAVNGSGAREGDVFFHYKDYIYFWEAGARLTRHGDIKGSPSVATYQTIAYTNVAQPVHHPADDIAYFFSDNKVHKLNDTSWTPNVLELPDNLIITSACAYGDYLAIACKSKELTGHSIVFLWDRDSSVNDLSRKIDWGEGQIQILETVDDVLIGLSNVATGFFGIKHKIHIKGYAGGLSFLQELDVDDETTGDEGYSIPNKAKGFVRNSKLYFPVSSGVSGDNKNYTGIWVLGRHEVGSPFAVTMYQHIPTDGGADFIDGFYFAGDYLYVAHSNDGSVDRTNNSEVYDTGIYESYIFNGENSRQTKSFIGATLTTEPLPSGATVVLQYKKDAETSWTTLLTADTDDEIRHSKIGVIGDFKEIQFRIQSTGGAKVTGLIFKYETKDNDLYE